MELVREHVEDYTGHGCEECGGHNAYGKLFRYGTEADGLYSRTHWHKGSFCGKACHDAYHGGEF